MEFSRSKFLKYVTKFSRFARAPLGNRSFLINVSKKNDVKFSKLSQDNLLQKVITMKITKSNYDVDIIEGKLNMQKRNYQTYSPEQFERIQKQQHPQSSEGDENNEVVHNPEENDEPQWERGNPIALYSLIIINLYFFILMFFFSSVKERRDIMNKYGFTLWNFEHGRYFSMISSAFLHTSMLHIFGNMWAMFNFASMIYMCPYVLSPNIHLLGIYFVGAICSSLFVYFIHRFFYGKTIRSKKRDEITVHAGASGAVVAIGVIASMLAPDAQFGIMFLPGSAGLKKIMFGFILVESVLEFISINKGQELFGISHAGHLGGALGGILYGLFLMKLRI